MFRLLRPLRGLARSHRYCTGLEPVGNPVGAGKP
ncbi:DNA mismatch repair protein MutT, partial [Pseudomonas plecoglossicida]